MINIFTNPLDIIGIEYFHRFFLEPTYVFEGHAHNSVEMNVVLKGAVEITCGSSVLTARAGDMILIKPGVFHKNHALSSNVSDMVSAHLITGGINFSNEYHRCTLDEESLFVLKMLLEEIENECHANDGCTAGDMTAASKKMLEILLLRALRCENKPVYSKDNDSLVYHNAVNFMMKNMNKNLSMREIAFEAGVCETILKRAFSKFAGRGVMAHFTHLKTELAKKLLAEGKSCYEVSEALGYSSQAYFSRCFKKNTGILPSEIQNSKRSGA